MNREDAEKELETLLGNFTVKQTPKEVTEGFEQGVWKKINQGAEPLDWKFALVLGAASVALITAVFIWGIMPLVKRSTPDTINPQVIRREIQRLQADQDARAAAIPVVRELEAEQPAPALPAAPAAANEEALFEDISEELFILQLLGEDAGILDDYGILESDIQILTQIEARGI